jgi:hypothetical protein
MTKRPYRRYPWTSLAVGEAFFVEGDYDRGHAMSNAAHAFAKKHPEYKFAVRKVSGGYRCTRVPT